MNVFPSSTPDTNSAHLRRPRPDHVQHLAHRLVRNFFYNVDHAFLMKEGTSSRR